MPTIVFIVRCRPSRTRPPRMICSAGLEWRDYPTLIEAVTGMDVEVRLAAASPWSKHRNETENRDLPPNVSAAVRVQRTAAIIRRLAVCRRAAV